MDVTIRDVARKAKVSPATVSRVFNHDHLVKPATRARIRAVAEQMGYTPNATARSLSHGRTKTLGVVLPDPHGEFFSEIIRGLDEGAQAARYHLLISSSHHRLEETDAALETLAGRIDGVVIMSTRVEAQRLLDRKTSSTPTVFINTAMEGARCDAFNFENREGAYQVVRHLIDLGHRRIAIINGPPENFDVKERLVGCREALREAELDPDAQPVEEGDFTQKSGYEAGRRIVGTGALPDALFACNDYMAMGAMAAFQEAGLRVPDEIAVAGFDDITSACYTNPPLTTARVPVYELGRQAIERLVARIEAPEPLEPRVRVLASELQVRASTEEA